jgi:hypothetical protein
VKERVNIAATFKCCAVLCIMLFTIIIATAWLAIDIVESGHWCLEIALVIDDYQFAQNPPMEIKLKLRITSMLGVYI